MNKDSITEIKHVCFDFISALWQGVPLPSPRILWLRVCGGFTAEVIPLPIFDN